VTLFSHLAIDTSPCARPMMTQISQMGSPMDPQSIGPYEVLKTLGAGGMGNVYLGQHRDTKRLAAIKVLPPTLAREEGFRLRFDREVAALDKLSNDHIVRLYDSGVDGETYYFAMEYVPGETLGQMLKRERRLPWKTAVDFTRQLCTALKAAHDAGIVHRDLKPSNILCTPEGMIKLTDFGVAQLFASDKLTVTGGVVGTAEYMSPEQAQGQRAGKRSDLYSLGAVMYVMLTGRPPFTGPTHVDILQKHRFGQFDHPSRFVPETPRWLDEIVAQLLEKDPEKRFPDAYVLARQIEQRLLIDQQRSSDATAVEGADVTGLASEAPASGPGMATLMRNLVREEVRRQSEPSGWDQLTNNTWILVTLLMLLICGVYWAMQRPTEESLYREAEQLMRQPPGADWERARDEYLQPLLERNRLDWINKVQPWLDDIDAYEAEQRLMRTRRRSGAVQTTEPERLLRSARQMWDQGQTVAARDRLKQVLSLLKFHSDPSAGPLVAVAERWLEQWDQQLNETSSPGEFLGASLKSAEGLMARGGVAEASEILTSMIALYADHPSAQPAIERARVMLKQSPGQAGSSAATAPSPEASPTPSPTPSPEPPSATSTP
jgi:serine/threonine protein kinase